MSYVYINQEELRENGICPYCGWKDQVDWEGSVVTYECECCGFSTRFIGPDGLSQDEIGDYDEGDDGAFMDAVETAENDALENCSVPHALPSDETVAGAKIITAVNRFSSDFADFISFNVIDDEAHPWRASKKKAVAYLIVKIFQKYVE